MTYVKKMVMKGFKSFAPETEINFENSMNVIVGPNGSGKSNIADSICFVLGRLSIKSMRAAKAAHLIFAGTKDHRPASEASVKMIFDNSDKLFQVAAKDIEIERVVRHNGQSIYKINNEIKTRQEVLELLAVAGIDPNGFNIVLQGEIQSVVKMHPEERRQVIEEVSGISVYETRKEKSLHELERTDLKLKEVSAILRERTAYLRNLEQERAQALKFKQLEETVKRCKASILNKQIDEKRRELKSIEEEIEKRSKGRDKAKNAITELQHQIESLELKINEINSHIQKSTGIEQETLYSQLTELRESLAGLEVHKANSEKKLEEVLARRQRADSSILELDRVISELRKKSPLQAQKQQELEKKKHDMDELESQKRRFFSIKSELQAIKNRVEDKKSQISRNKNESDFLIQEITSLGEGLNYKTVQQVIAHLKNTKQELEEKIKKTDSFRKQTLSGEKSISVYESEIEKLNDIKVQVSKLDICPLCKTKITHEHLSQVMNDSDSKIKEIAKSLNEARKELDKSVSEEKITIDQIDSLKKSIAVSEIEKIKLENIEKRTEHLKRLGKDREMLEKELESLTKEKEKLSDMESKFKYSEEKYEQTLLEIEQISSRTEENLDLELEMKARELEQTKLIIKQSVRDEQELKEDIVEKERELREKSKLLEEKEEQEIKLKEKFNKMFEQRTELQKEIQKFNLELVNKQHESQSIEQELNDTKINKARVDAERSTLEIDYSAFAGAELISGSLEFLREKLQKSEDSLRVIGSVNLRALEVYEEIKKEYDAVAVKVEQLEKEKIEIMKIIEEIDIKKKKTFMKTLSAINELFTRNFMQLSTKGQVFLDLENKEDPFAAGLDIVVKVGKGKYFDVTSLSGGEQTLVALSLIFAIQEYKPYCFYIFDEIDAALDKRNSERLAMLIKKHMKSGQYIIVTHNDALITESNVLYGVTMQEGISKILSLQV